LKDLGVEFENNSVIKTTQHKYLHPKEALVTNGMIHKALVPKIKNAEEKEIESKFNIKTILDENDDTDINNYTGLKIIYPFGCALKLSGSAIPILNSGTVSYPVNSTLIGFASKGKGRVIVSGSWKILEDSYIDQEDNLKLFEYLIKILTNNDLLKDFLKITKAVKNTQYNSATVPNIESLSEKLKCCIQESPSISQNFLNKFKIKLYESDFEKLPEALKLFEKLNVPYNNLKLIPPSFETPLLGLTPAVFPPILIDIEPPKLELFDLDDEFAISE